MNDDDINEFDPSKESASEFNPYENINSLDDSEGSLDDNNISSNKIKNEPLKEEYTDSNNENDSIDLPDFMKSSDDYSEYREKKNSKESTDEGISSVNENQVQNNAGEYENKEEQDKQNTDNNKSESVKQDLSNSNSGGNTEDIPEEIKFKPKVSADDADKRPGSKPKILNKKFLLTIIIVTIGCIFMIVFLMPEKSKKQKKTEKPVAEVHYSTDYEAMAKKKTVEDNGHYEDKNVNNYKNPEEEAEIPPVIPKTEKPVYTPENINYNSGKGGGASSTVEIPDTRNDRLQAKAITGIKGLSSSQSSYSTDYQQTIEKNTRSTTASNYTLPSKEEYMNNVLGAYSQAYGNATSQNNAYAVQNDQSGKNSFYNNGRNGDSVGQGEYLNLNTLWQGTIFEAILTSELNTDLPGEITARIAKNIYSSQDGRYLLIPQNSIVYGTYNSSISYSQNRVQVAWHTLVRPDGYQIQLGNMNGTDAKGASGLKGFVNDHPMAYLKAIGLMSVFSIVNSEFESAMGSYDNEYVQNVLANGQEVTMELGDKLIDRAMNVQPTIKIKSGTKINIVVNQNLSLPPCDDIPVTQQYRRRK